MCILLLRVVPTGTNYVSTLAFVDTVAARAIYPPYIYTPRNASNVAVSTTTTNPIVDYDIIKDAIIKHTQDSEVLAKTTELVIIKNQIIGSRSVSVPS